MPASARQCPDAIRNFNFDLEGRNLIAALHVHADTVWLNFDMPGHSSENFFAQRGHFCVFRRSALATATVTEILLDKVNRSVS